MTLRLAAMLALMSIPAVVHAAETEAERQARLEKGETVIDVEEVPGSKVPKVTVRAIINAPAEKIWAIIDQCGRYSETMVRIKESKELSRDGNKIRCEVLLSSPGPIKNLRARTSATHTVTEGKWVRAWTLEAGDYKRNDGSWTLTRHEANPKRTRVQYQVISEPDIWVPGWLQEYAVKKGLPGLIEKIRSQVE